MNQDCCICLEPLSNNIFTLQPCNHQIHDLCFDGFQKLECPLCRCLIENPTEKVMDNIYINDIENNYSLVTDEENFVFNFLSNIHINIISLCKKIPPILLPDYIDIDINKETLYLLEEKYYILLILENMIFHILNKNENSDNVKVEDKKQFTKYLNRLFTIIQDFSSESFVLFSKEEYHNITPEIEDIKPLSICINITDVDV